ncbi:MAG: DUF1638 domain-containing protein [Hyphomicrobiales bacterium]|nr:DUF1638 domain-containing protein [Hyphomicrobiales bacterium]
MRTTGEGAQARPGAREIAARAPLPADPDAAFDAEPASLSADSPKTLVIACGALAKELLAAIRLNRWSHLAVTCLPAILHNRPERITEAVRGKIQANRERYRRILCLYGDCGTGGQLDTMLAEEGVERIEGAHCYAFYAGLGAFEEMMEEEIGTFFLTDYLVRFFDRLVMEGLGLDRHPELLSDYFGNYRKLVWLTQAPNAGLERRAEAAAKTLGLPLERRETGLRGIEDFLARQGKPESSGSKLVWPPRQR